jgi:signal transduction histidine kinase
MNIPDFIDQDVSAIVDEWVEFARSAQANADELTTQDLADHARVLLLAVASDLRKHQGAKARHEKAQGNRPRNAPEITRVARDHAAQRFEQAFSFDHLVSEFRALRASVIRRWTKQLTEVGAKELEELTRFGEAMDQAMAASVSLYTKKIEDSRNLLLGVLGHDLRTPVGVVHMSASYLLRGDALPSAQTKAVARILTSAERVKAMVNDLLDFTRTAIGVTLPITPVPADLAKISRDIVEEVTVLHPDSILELTCEGDLCGRWDATRVAQALSNLATNAVHHGGARPVTVHVGDSGENVSVHIHNEGTAIPPEKQKNLFAPLRQVRAPQPEGRGSSGLGLGLYITKEIVVAHGGSIKVESGEEGTTVIVTLPRTPPVHADRRAAKPQE